MRANLAVTHDRAAVIGIELVRPAGLAGTAPYAYAAVTDPGRMAFTAGACPLDAEGNTVAVGDVAGQARQVMANLVTALEGAGAGLVDVLKTTVYVATTDRADLVAAWEVVREAFGEHDAPSTLVGVTVLGYPDQLVEVEAVAVLDSWREPAPPHDHPEQDD
jgi:enamine deaminase RidA (YjgF/YER057c/UK114 family)